MKSIHGWKLRRRYSVVSLVQALGLRKFSRHLNTILIPTKKRTNLGIESGRVTSYPFPKQWQTNIQTQYSSTVGKVSTESSCSSKKFHSTESTFCLEIALLNLARSGYYQGLRLKIWPIDSSHAATMCARTLIYQVKRLQWRQAFLVYLVVFTVTSGILRAYWERYVNRVGVPELWSSTYQRLGTSSCDKCIPHEN